MSFFTLLADLERSSFDAALCTVVAVKGSTPRKAGAKMIVIDNKKPHGQLMGTIGGGAIEHLIRKKALSILAEKRSLLISVSLRNELGMCCGGEMTVFIEPIIKKPKIICFGAGHISQSLCMLLSELNYEIFVADSRPELLNHEAFMKARRVYDDLSVFSLNDMPFSPDTYVVIATHDHEVDQKIVEKILAHPFKYGALVGSMRKAHMTRKRLVAKGFTEQEISRIYCPAGLNINAESPQEIALSIASQMIQVKNGASRNRSNDRSSWPEQTYGF